MKTWTFILDGEQGRAERYGPKQADIYIFWKSVGCHITGLLPSAQTVIWNAEAVYDDNKIPQLVGSGGINPLNENGWTP